MSADTLLAHLEAVKRTGAGRWIARCPAHEDKSPSLSIRETEDGKTLLHCFAGCSVHEVVDALGLELSDLFPQRPDGHAGKPERRPFSSDDALRCVDFEATVIYLCASDMSKGRALSDAERERLLLACGRINTAMGVCSR